METLVLKIVICSGILLGLYHLFLSKEKTFVFNRFYLIFSVIFSLTIPFLTIELPELNEEKPTLLIEQEISQPILTGQIVEEKSFDLNQILLTTYCLIAVFFLAKFIFSVLKIKNLQGRKIIYKSKKIVLLKRDLAPFSFWNTIYISEKSFNDYGIDERVFLHEEIHIQQKHSLDLVFIELTKAVLWINPFFYFYKNAMVNNHEFLADEEVINKKTDIKNYQELILQEVLKQQNLSLTHQFNFNNTKKRFIMMTKQNSKFAKVKKFLAVPVFAIAAFVFAEKVYGSDSIKDVISETQSKDESANSYNPNAYSAYINLMQKYYHFLDENDYIGFSNSITKSDKEKFLELYNQLSYDQQDIAPVSFREKVWKWPRKQITRDIIEKYQDENTYMIRVDEVRVKNSDLYHYKNGELATFMEMRINPGIKSKQSHSVLFFTEGYYKKKYNQKYIQLNIKNLSNTISPLPDTIRPQKTVEAKVTQERPSKNDERTVTDVAVATAVPNQDQEKTPAEFPGGMNDFRRSVAENFNQVPFENKGGTLSTVIMISIDENGNTTDMKANGDDVTFNNEALRTVKLITANKVWKPATENGKSVKSVFKLPLKMQFAKNSPAK